MEVHHITIKEGAINLGHKKEETTGTNIFLVAQLLSN